MRRAIPIVVLLLLGLCALSCRDLSRSSSFGMSERVSVRSALAHAEVLMETDPHAARAVLDSLGPHLNLNGLYTPLSPPVIGGQKPLKGRGHRAAGLPSFRRGKGEAFRRGRGEAALYALLRTQADYKCDIPIRSDSLARIATDYYGTPRRPDYHAALAWYTLGCAYGDMNDDVNATDAFLNAKSLFPDTLIRYYALTEQNLGIHHLNRHMTREAAQDFLSAKQNLIRLGDSTAVAFLDLSLARCCLYREDYASAREWLNRVFQNSHASQYVFTVAHFEMAKVETYYTHDYAKALDYIDYDIQHTPNKKELTGTYSLKAAILQEQGSLDSAWHYYHRSLNSQSSPTTFSYVYRQMAILAPRLGKADSIADYVRLYHTYIDSLYIISNQQAIRQAMNDHRVEMEQQRLEGQHRRLVLTLSLAALALVVLVLAVLVWSLNTANKKKQQYIQISDQLKQSQMEEERRKTELASTKEEAERLKVAYQEARQRVDELESQYKETTSDLQMSHTPQAERRLILSDYENRIRICVNQFQKDLSWALVQKYLHGSEHFLTKQERIAIRHDLNVCFTDYFEILQAEGKKVNQTEKIVSACYILGFNSEETEEILGCSAETVRVQKHRLKGKLPADFYEIVFSFRL